MFRPVSSILVATALLAVSVVTSSAQADVPAPPGTRRVPFEIRVERLAAFPEMVVVVYPYSLSNGAPTHEHAVLRDGEPMPLGRRSETPKLWAVKKADYEAFAATYKPTRSFQDAPLDAFFKSGKARECHATVQPVFELPFADPRAAAVQSFHAEAIDATQCKLTAAAPPHPAPTDTGERAEPVATPPDAPREGRDPSGPPAAKGGGCAGCMTASALDDGWAVAAGTMCVVGLGIARRRRARRRP